MVLLLAVRQVTNGKSPLRRSVTPMLTRHINSRVRTVLVPSHGLAPLPAISSLTQVSTRLSGTFHGVVL